MNGQTVTVGRSIVLANLVSLLVFGTLSHPAAADLTPLSYDCLTQAADRFQVAPLALMLILSVEGGKVGQCSTNHNGSRDCGPAQINSVHLPDLARLTGWSEADVARSIRDNGCLNIEVAAWLLRRAIEGAGGDVQEGLGRYHSRTPALKQRYLAKMIGTFNRRFSPRGRTDLLHSPGTEPP